MQCRKTLLVIAPTSDNIYWLLHNLAFVIGFVYYYAIPPWYLWCRVVAFKLLCERFSIRLGRNVVVGEEEVVVELSL
jgi:hypothetical protein